MDLSILKEHVRNPDPSVYMEDSYLVLDFEIDTGFGDHGRALHKENRMLLACWTTSGSPGIYSCWSDEFGMEQLTLAIKKVKYIVAHNAKYELAWLQRCGLDLAEVVVFDTMIAEYVLLGNRAAGGEGMAPIGISLDDLCQRRGLPLKDPAVDTMIKHGINPAAIPRKWLEGRCRRDVETTKQIFLDQRKTMQEQGLLPVLYTRCLLTPVLAEIELEGMRVDEDCVQQVYDEHRALLIEHDARMGEITGGINWRSSKQAGAFVYDKLGFSELKLRSGEPIRTATGQRMTDTKTLDKLEASTQEQRDFLALRKKLGKISAALSKSLEFFAGVSVEKGGVFYAEFNQTNTATHRLSSSGIPQKFSAFGEKKKSVQFQNLPRAFKRLFRAKKDGWLMAEVDGSQLEFRVAAFLGQDTRAMWDIEDPNFDIHILSGSTMAGKDYYDCLASYRAGDTAATAVRQNGKAESFKPLYGGSVGTTKQMRWYDEFKKRYSQLNKVQESWVGRVVIDKKLVTPWGLVYYWPHAKYSKNGHCNVKSSVYNYPVQGLATAEIIPVAVVYFWHAVRAAGLGDKIRLVNTVHDSLVAEIHPDMREEFVRIATWAFTTAVYQYLKKVYRLAFNVPLGVGIKIGEYWGQGTETGFNVWNNGRIERIVK